MQNESHMNEELLVLVDEEDKPVGTMEKMEAHKTGALHRAFSLFVFDTDMKLLLQQRADTKYHSAGLWSNTCCSHPKYGEKTIDAVERRLKEEMGLECEPILIFSFVYRAELANGLIEHEYDHVYVGTLTKQPVPDPREVKAWKYMSLTELKNDIAGNPEQYTEWLKICLPKVIDFFGVNYL